MSTPEVELLLTSNESALPIRNLYPLYLHDIACYEHKPPNRHGVLADADEVRTWDELLAGQAAWWQRPGTLFPYLILKAGVPAGFSFVSSGPYVQHEFFVVHTWRGSGVAAEAFRMGLARHPGRWEVATWSTAPRAVAFWRKTLMVCTGGDARETEEDHPWGRRIVWRFHNPLDRDRSGAP